MAAARCRALDSESRPTSTPTPAATAQIAASASVPDSSSSLTILVTKAASPSAAPAPMISRATGGAPRMLAATGAIVSTPSNPSATASPASRGTVPGSGGAAHAISPTATTMIATADHSRRPTCSPSRRTPSPSNRKSPRARTGWTRVSGALVRASTCRPQPTIASPIAASQIGRCARCVSRPGRIDTSMGARRASNACSAYPESYASAATSATTKPKTRSESIIRRLPSSGRSSGPAPRRRPPDQVACSGAVSASSEAVRSRRAAVKLDIAIAAPIALSSTPFGWGAINPSPWREPGIARIRA